MRLHIEPDQLHQAARTLWQINYQIADYLYELRIQSYRLEMAWQGGDAEEYTYELRLLITRLEQRLDELLSLGLILARQAERWDESDQRWKEAYDQLTFHLFGE